jgi:hypothetical protein
MLAQLVGEIAGVQGVVHALEPGAVVLHALGESLESESFGGGHERTAFAAARARGEGADANRLKIASSRCERLNVFSMCQTVADSLAGCQGVIENL